MKRSSCPKMDIIKLGPTQTHVNEKRCKTEPSEDNLMGSNTRYENQLEYIANEDSLSRKFKANIGKFIYESGLDFDSVNLPSFESLCSLCLQHTKYQIPSPDELKGSVFNDVMKEMRDYVNDVRKSWADTGCTILLDEWTDEKGRNLIDILVACPKGTIYLRSSDISDFIGKMDSMLLFFDKLLLEIEIKNVVQIITNLTSGFMKEVGKLLMEKYRSVFWSVSASCCIELMLEKFGEIGIIKETLEKAKIITKFVYSRPNVKTLVQELTEGRDLVPSRSKRSILPFLTVENIVLEKEILRTIFVSSDSKAPSTEWKRVAEIVANRSFWNGASIVLKTAIPLVRIIEWLENDKEVQMGYIYETIDQAKEKIKEGFKHNKSRYMPYWKIIDRVWDDNLHNPLHSAGYYLNPNLFYSSGVHIDPEVATGLLCCIVRSTEDVRVQDRIIIQMEQYRARKGDFGLDKRFDISPVVWWSKYGEKCPELQRLAIRILSQPCDVASRFQSLAENLLKKERNRVEPKILTDMVFIRYNMWLKNLSNGKINKSFDFESPSDDLEWMGI